MIQEALPTKCLFLFILITGVSIEHSLYPVEFARRCLDDNSKMADFFAPNTPNDGEGSNLQDQPITIGDKQYTQAELNELVGLGSIAREVEQKYNTKIDRVYPEYTKSTQELKRLKEELEQFKNQKPQTQNIEELDETQKLQAKKAAKALDILTKEDISELGLMTKSDVEAFINDYRAGEKLLEQSRGLEGKYDGKDGRPAFKTEDILEYMRETGIKEPELAYKVKYEEQINSWKERKTQEARKQGLVTETASSAGNKSPQPVKVTRDNLDKLVAEALGGQL